MCAGRGERFSSLLDVVKSYSVSSGISPGVEGAGFGLGVVEASGSSSWWFGESVILRSCSIVAV